MIIYRHRLNQPYPSQDKLRKIPIQIVEWACKEFKDLYLVPALEVKMGARGIGMEDAENASKVRRFFIGDEEDTIGFFIAKFRKLM